MAPKKSKFIWFVLILFLLGNVISLSFIVSELVSFNLNYILSYYFLLDLVITILSIIFLYKLYYLKEDVVKWTHIAFISSILYFSIGYYEGLLEEDAGQAVQEMGASVEGGAILMIILLSIFTVVLFSVILLFWFLFSRHLKKFLKKRVEKSNENVN